MPTTWVADNGKPVVRRGRKARGLASRRDSSVAGKGARALIRQASLKELSVPMSRLRVLAANPRLALGALLTLLLAAGAVVGSGADFTASSANPANTFASGTLSIVNSKEGAAVLTASNLKPGGTAATGTVDIQNSGSLAGA